MLPDMGVPEFSSSRALGADGSAAAIRYRYYKLLQHLWSGLPHCAVIAMKPCCELGPNRLTNAVS